MSSEREMAGFVSRTKFEDLPEDVVRATKRHVFDTIGAGLGGLAAPGISPVIEYVKEMGGKKSATILAYGFKVPPTLAALVNASMCHALEFDNHHSVVSIHTGVVTIPAVFSAAEYIGGISGKELINALTLGIDVHCRLGLSAKSYIGWARPSLYGYFAAATAVAKLLKLDVESILNAWGIAYSQAAGNLEMVADGGLTKRLQVGFAASGGVLAGLLANKGITGSKNSFEGRRGIFNLYERGEYDSAPLTMALGKEYKVMDFSFKPYPCCASNHAAIDGALEITAKYDIKPENIEEVRIGIGSHGFEVVCEPIDAKRNPRNIVDAQFSIPYTVACALVKKKVSLDDFTKESIQNPVVLRIASRVYTFLDPEIERGVGGTVIPANIVLKTKTGEVYSTRVDFQKGHPKNPMTDEEFEAKFRSCVRFGISGFSPKKLDELIYLLRHLEQVDDIKKVTKLFCLQD